MWWAKKFPLTWTVCNAVFDFSWRVSACRKWVEFLGVACCTYTNSWTRPVHSNSTMNKNWGQKKKKRVPSSTTFISFCLRMHLAPLRRPNKISVRPEQRTSSIKVSFKWQHSVNSVTWLLAVREACSTTGKSIEHAVPENAGMITIEKRHCMPVLPCLHIVSYPFFLIAGGLSDALYPMPGPFSKQTIHKQKKQSGKCS